MAYGMKTFIAVSVFAAVAEGAVIYGQMPAEQRKYCASTELGDLLRAAAQAEADLRHARASFQRAPDENGSKEIMRLEAQSAAALNVVAGYKQRVKQAGGNAAGEAPCR